MKSLCERLLDDENDLISEVDDELLKQSIYNIYDEKYITHIDIKDKKAYIRGTLQVKDKRHITTLEIPGLTIARLSGDFHCGWCRKLISLKGSPEEVYGNFTCDFCYNITSLEGAPEKVSGFFNCNNCHELTTLDGAPKKTKAFNCSECDQLKTLDGAPEKVDGRFNCSGCSNLISLKGLKEVTDVIIAKNCDNLKDYNKIPFYKILD